MCHWIATVAALLLFASATAAPTAFGVNNWMGSLYPFIKETTLLDITLPGTHDSMTFNLSDTVSDGANDLPPEISWILHDFHDFAGLAGYIHDQAQTQELSMTQQLEAGMRFIDFRVMYSAGPNASSSASYDWYCLHLVQSNQPARAYLDELKVWLDANPTESVVLWVSRHGSECGNEYPDVSNAELRRFFNEIVGIFGESRLINTPLNTTTIAELRERGQQLALMVSSFDNVTGGNTTLASDACKTLDNSLGPGVTEEPVARKSLLKAFKEASDRRAQDKAVNKLYLRSLSGGPPKQQMIDGFFMRYLPFEAKKFAASCAKAFNIPNMTAWCPPSLRAVGQMTNYYNQAAFEAVMKDPQTYAFPGAFYIDGIGPAGTLRTGTATSGPTTGYSYTGTIARFNLLRSVGGAAKCGADAACKALLGEIDANRAKFPAKFWEDPEHGRLVNWP